MTNNYADVCPLSEHRQERLQRPSIRTGQRSSVDIHKEDNP